MLVCFMDWKRRETAEMNRLFPRYLRRVLHYLFYFNAVMCQGMPLIVELINLVPLLFFFLPFFSLIVSGLFS